MVMRKIFLKLGTTLCAVLLLLWSTDLSSVWQQIRQINMLTILGCMTALFFAQAMSSLRWEWILEAEGARVRFRTLLASYMVGMFVNNFMPTSIGGDAVKTYDIYRFTRNISLSVVSVFVERFSGLLTLLMLSWLGIIFILSVSSTLLLWGWISINVVCILLVLSLLHKTLTDRISQYIETKGLAKAGKLLRLICERLVSYRNRRTLLMKLLILSLPIQLVTIVIYRQISMAMDIHLPFVFYLFSVPLIILISLLPISLGGLGVREGTTVLVFSIGGVSTDPALAISLAYMGIYYMVSLIGGLLLIFRSTGITESRHLKNDLLEDSKK
jgi:uncharacterized protein (TIRG00374 family)